MAASPDGTGFEAKFESFSVKHLPDQRRTGVAEKSPVKIKQIVPIIITFVFLYTPANFIR
jgi:hypothetical protein